MATHAVRSKARYLWRVFKGWTNFSICASKSMSKKLEFYLNSNTRNVSVCSLANGCLSCMLSRNRGFDKLLDRILKR